MNVRVVCIVSVLLLAACTQSGSDAQTAIDKTSPFVGGTDAVALSFLNTRDEVFDAGSDPFEVVVQLQNKGEYTVRKDDVRVRIAGINAKEFNKLDEDLVISSSEDLLGLSKDAQGNTLLGRQSTVEFTELNYQGKVVGATQTFPLVVDLCHSYRTDAVTNICILGDVLGGSSVCKVEEKKTAFSSGSPIHVEDMQEFGRAKDKIGFTFTIKHVGSGTTYEKASRCVNDRAKNKVLVHIDARMDGLQCTGLMQKNGTAVEGSVQLIEGSKTISCSQIVTRKADFEQPVQITLGYDYDVQARKQLTVKSSGKTDQ